VNNATASETAPPVKKTRRVFRIRFLVTVAILLIMALVIPFRIRVNRERVVAAMSKSLGRQVSIGSIHYRLLPWPGFTIENFTVADDPEFSPEPVIRAENVTANIRLSSLWRGHLEISRLHFDEPSLNLVRNNAGLWNVQSILLRASQIPSAPTNKRIAEERVRFPYIEASLGRINLRLGNEKKPLTFMDSDFILWLGSENRWNLEFSARPTRTDMNLTDLGIIRGRGTIQRANSLATMPLNLHLTWDNAQLGQTTKLILGNDRGWRSGIALTADLAGTPDDLAFTLRLGLDGFRRADIVSVNSLVLNVECTGHAHYDDASISPLNCNVPLEKGLLSVRGNVQQLHGVPQPDLQVVAENIPASALLALARRVKRSIPDDLQANGSLSAAFVLAPPVSADGTMQPHRWKGEGTLTGLQLSSAALTPPLVVGDVKFEEGIELPTPTPASRKRKQVAVSQPAMSPAGLNILPFNMDLGGDAPARVDGLISTQDASLHLQGAFRLQRILTLANALGLRPIQTAADGSMQGNFTISSAWRELMVPTLTGTATIDKLQWKSAQLNAPVTLSGGIVSITPDTSHLSGFEVEIGKDLTMHGDVGFRRGCSPITECDFRFELTTASLSTDTLNQVLNPSLHDHGFSLFGTAKQPTPWQWLHAQGTLQIEQVQLGKLPLRHCSSFASIGQSIVTLHALHCQAFHGDHSGDWTLDFSGEHPKFSGSGKVTHAAIADAGNLFHEEWGSGSVDGEYKIEFSGEHAPDFAASAKGTITPSIQNGVWKHARVPLTGPLQFSSWKMPMELSGGTLTVKDGLLKLPKQSLAVNGTIGLDRIVHLDFIPTDDAANAAAFHAEGSVQNPTISSISAAHSSDTRVFRNH